MVNDFVWKDAWTPTYSNHSSCGRNNLSSFTRTWAGPQTTKSYLYLWLYRTGREDITIVLFDYPPIRAGEHPKRFLTGFKGYFQVDGYSGYHQVPDVTLFGCWAHARRKFDEALKALSESQKGKKVKASEGLHFCNQLYSIERKFKRVILYDSTTVMEYVLFNSLFFLINLLL